MRLNTVLSGERGHIGDAAQFLRGALTVAIEDCVGILAGVEFYHGSAKAIGGIKLPLACLDEKRDADARAL